MLCPLVILRWFDPCIGVYILAHWQDLGIYIGRAELFATIKHAGIVVDHGPKRHCFRELYRITLERWICIDILKDFSNHLIAETILFLESLRLTYVELDTFASKQSYTGHQVEIRFQVSLVHLSCFPKSDFQPELTCQ